tara:strand:- start:95 stop:418 length:324 start_codon:yes stop_codon:yes gene_type:complete
MLEQTGEKNTVEAIEAIIFKNKLKKLEEQGKSIEKEIFTLKNTKKKFVNEVTNSLPVSKNIPYAIGAFEHSTTLAVKVYVEDYTYKLWFVNSEDIQNLDSEGRRKSN